MSVAIQIDDTCSGGAIVMTLQADLHIHSALSPCAADDMSPPAIVQAALECGLQMIAVCDHNAAGNVAATQVAAANLARARAADGRAALTVFAGIEITTAEEVHVLGLFRSAADAAEVAGALGAGLPTADAAYYERFGHQLLMDPDGAVCGEEGRMLATATSWDLAAVVALIHRQGGVAIAAHVNRPSFSVLSQLGLFPTDVGFDAIEVFMPCDCALGDGESAGGAGGMADASAPRANRRRADAAKFGGLGLPVCSSSDAHFLNDVGRCRTAITLASPTFDEFVLAVRGVGGRGVRCA